MLGSRHGSAALLIQEPLQDLLIAVELSWRDIPAGLQPVPEERGANPVHKSQSLALIRQVFHVRRLPLSWPWPPAAGAAEQVTQDLAEDVTAGKLRLVPSPRCRGGLPGHRNLDRPAADDHRLDPPLADSFLELAQDMAEQIAFGCTGWTRGLTRA
jgi:hypothetical protein